jgi:hypothetical protein
MSLTFSELSKTSRLVTEFIKNTKNFLKIITFRFSSEDFANMLIDKTKAGVDIEIITTPADNIGKQDLRSKVEEMYKRLQANGVRLLTCPWEVGEPRLTPTSMSGRLAAGIGEKWYSLHLQLFINEKQTLLTSQNLVPEENLEIYYLSSEPYLLRQSLDKFNLIKDLFFTPVRVDNTVLQGRLVDFLDKAMLKDTLDFFNQNKRLKVKHYYVGQLPEAHLRKGLFLCPFEGRLREFFEKFVDAGQSFLYFFVEGFFDEESIKKFDEKINLQPDIQVKIITRPPQRIRQAPHKARNMIKQLLSLGVGIGYLLDIQAKFWVSDNWLAIPSGDFNRINLGYYTSKNYWRADTQLLFLDDNPEQIKIFKAMFEQHFKPIDIGSICRKDIDSLFAGLRKRYNLVGTREAKDYISRLKSSLIIKTEKDVRYVMNLAVRLTKIYNKKRIEGIFVVMAIVLYYLQRREHKFEEISEKLENIADKSKISDAINRLLLLGFILKIEDVYRVNVEKLLGLS